MNAGQTVFSHIIDFVPSYAFQRCIARYCGDAHDRGFSCRDPYLAMALAQLTYRESLRGIEACLAAMRGKLYRMGFRGRVTRSTLGDANEAHDLRIKAFFAEPAKMRSKPKSGSPSASTYWSPSSVNDGVWRPASTKSYRFSA